MNSREWRWNAPEPALLKWRPSSVLPAGFNSYLGESLCKPRSIHPWRRAVYGWAVPTCLDTKARSSSSPEELCARGTVTWCECATTESLSPDAQVYLTRVADQSKAYLQRWCPQRLRTLRQHGEERFSPGAPSPNPGVPARWKSPVLGPRQPLPL